MKTHGLKETKRRWSKTMEEYPLAIQISLFGVFLSTSSVDATLLGVKEAPLSNHTPVPMPMKKAPAMR